MVIDGARYATVENYFQSQKFHDAQYREVIRNAISPSGAASYGRQREGRGRGSNAVINNIIREHKARGVAMREDWDEVKDAVMLTALKAKFAQHPVLATLLQETGDKPIVEASPTDYYWGCGRTGTGKNRPGELLVDVRTWLRSVA
jgi:ribA/ribD-fused uncharacterized protein